jgi:hypothetical protein
MDRSERKMRERLQTLYDSNKKMDDERFREITDLRTTLIKTYGWARGKKMPNGRFNMLEKP